MTEARTLITNPGKVVLLKRAYTANPLVTAPSYFKARAGGPDITVGSTSLGIDIPISNGTSVDLCQSTSGWTASNGTTSVNEVNKIKGTGSLHLTKTSTIADTVSITKTFSSFNITDKRIYSFVFISSSLLSILSSVEIRLRSGVSDYISRSFDSLVSGWNAIFIDDTATQTGSPTLAALTSIYLSYTTEEVDDITTDGDFMFDDIKLVSDSDFTKNFVTSYPQVIDSSRESIIKGVLNSVEGVGFQVDGFAVFNTDSTPIMILADTFPSKTKTNKIELTYVRKNRRV